MNSFQNMKNMAYGEIFKSLVKRMSCLTTITYTTNEVQVSEMIEVMNELQLPQKYLIIFMETLNITKLSGRMINFNVMINHKGKGVHNPNYVVSIIKYSNNSYAICFSLQDGSWVLTSLCPTLGETYAQELIGVCPSHLQEPFGKTLRISFLGQPPFITYNPFGGSDFIVTKILAQKYSFIPKYIPARSYDKFEENNNTFGMVHWVSFYRRRDYILDLLL